MWPLCDPKNLLFSEVEAYWQWSRLLHRLLPPDGPQPLLLNLDETSIGRGLHSSLGIVITQACPILQIGGLRRVAPPRRRKRVRGAITHVAIIADRTKIQPLLPQVFLANPRLVSERAAAAARSARVHV